MLLDLCVSVGWGGGSVAYERLTLFRTVKRGYILSGATFHSRARLTGRIVCDQNCKYARGKKKKVACCCVRGRDIDRERTTTEHTPIMLPGAVSGEMVLHFNLISRECLLLWTTRKERELFTQLQRQHNILIQAGFYRNYFFG